MERTLLAAVAATLLAASAAHAEVIYTYTSNPLVETSGPSVGAVLDPMMVSLDFTDGGSYLGWSVTQDAVGTFQGTAGDIHFRTDAAGDVTRWYIPLTDGQRYASTVYTPSATGGTAFDFIVDLRPYPSLLGDDFDNPGAWTSTGRLANFTYDTPAVPEPAALGLFAVGGLLLAVRRGFR